MDALFSQLQAAIAGRFSLERELGRGGMAVVYLARDVALDRPVAIKLLPPDLAAQPDYRERFQREARTAAGLSHPHIVPIHLVEEQAGLVYFVMGFVEGETLGELVRRAGPLAPAEASRIVREVAWALAYAHSRGIVHRDIKPDNILLDKGSGRAMVTDFGIARVASRATVSQQGEILGTLQYMSPEQADAGATVDGRSDLYSLGATAFLALTGRLPLEAPTAMALLAMHLTEPAPPVSSVRADLPPKLAEAVDRCLAKDPAARFATAAELAAALGELPATRAIPPSILTLREATSTFQWMATFPGLAWLFTRGIAPESATAVGYVWLTFSVLGFGQFYGAVRGVVRNGHGAQDVALVAQDVFAAAQTDRNADVTRAQGRKIQRMLQHPVGRVVLAVFGVGYGGAAVNVLSVFLQNELSLSGVVAAIGGVAALGFAVACLAGALQRGPFRADRILVQNDERMRFLKRALGLVWNNPLTRAFFRFAGVGIEKPGNLIVEKAATEVLLGKAADDLFEALPKDVRARLKEVPDVIKALERAAQALRARRDDIARSIAEAGQMEGGHRDRVVAELETARGGAAERLALAVTALENLRLDLLRLRAGVGSAADLTGSLDEARRVGELVNAELEVRSLLAGPA